MKKRVIDANIFIVSSIIFTIIMLVTLAMVDLKLGTKLGEGVFYIKGHYKEMTEIGGEMKSTTVTEQGPGVITVPLALSLLITLIAAIFLPKKKKDEKVVK
ncbi:hypothetical protein [Neobacillus sp. DY30]|uniref:hypothetical protein n=1 Tax=Neobacillus sp. DY30 TaxID=3047871 RepID=UPI0024BFA9A4|nr:hypothetical protein [Neobacillus sp. DY30]WHY03319.1 hypothetical protein QNH29_14320 [Neobacillus sp. DY30]